MTPQKLGSQAAGKTSYGLPLKQARLLGEALSRVERSEVSRSQERDRDER